MKKRWFTLVEILLVAAIIVILAGISIPVISRASETGKLNRAAAECNSIQMAIKNFETEMLEMPNPDTPVPDQYIIGGYKDYKNTAMSSIPAVYKNFFTMMTGFSYADPIDTKLSDSDWKNNRKKITFLSPPAAYSRGEGFLDPWGKPYTIIYKTDGELKNELDSKEMIDKEVKPAGLAPTGTLLTPIAVFTREGRFISSAKKLNQENTVRYATSWEGVKTYAK